MPVLTTNTTCDRSVDEPVEYSHAGGAAVSDVTSPCSSVDFTDDDNDDDTDPQLGISVVIDTEAISEKYKRRHPRTKLKIRRSQILNKDDVKTAFGKDELNSDVVIVSGNIGNSLVSNGVINHKASTPCIGTNEAQDDLQADLPLAVEVDSKPETHDSDNDHLPDSKENDNSINTDFLPTQSDCIERQSSHGPENKLEAGVTVKPICNVPPKIDVALSDEPKKSNTDRPDEAPKALKEEHILPCMADNGNNIKDEIKIKQTLLIDNNENKENIETRADTSVERDADQFAFMKRPMIGEYYLSKPQMSSSPVSSDVTSSDASIVDAGAMDQTQEVVQQIEHKKPEKKKKRSLFARLFKKKKGKYLPADVEYDSEICKRICHNNMGIPYKEKNTSDFMNSSFGEHGKTVTFNESARKDGGNALKQKKQFSGPTITEEAISTPAGILKSTKATSNQSLSGDSFSHDIINTQRVSNYAVHESYDEVDSKMNFPSGGQNITIDQISVVKTKPDTFIHSIDNNDNNLSQVNAIDIQQTSRMSPSNKNCRMEDVESSLENPIFSDNAPKDPTGITQAITHGTLCSIESQSLEERIDNTVIFKNKNGQQETPQSCLLPTGCDSVLIANNSAKIETLIPPTEDRFTENLPDLLDEEICQTSNPGRVVDKCMNVRSEVAKINSESQQVRKFPDSMCNPFIVQNTRSSSSSEDSDTLSFKAMAQKNVQPNDRSTTSDLSCRNSVMCEANISRSISSSSSENPCVVQIPTDEIDITDHELQADSSKR